MLYEREQKLRSRLERVVSDFLPWPFKDVDRESDEFAETVSTIVNDAVMPALMREIVDLQAKEDHWHRPNKKGAAVKDHADDLALYQMNSEPALSLSKPDEKVNTLKTPMDSTLLQKTLKDLRAKMDIYREYLGSCTGFTGAEFRPTLLDRMQPIGRCSLCSGPVSQPRIWGGVGYPPASCERCGAIEDRVARLPVVPMIPSTTLELDAGAYFPNATCETSPIKKSED